MQLMEDLRYAWRSLLSRPGFTLVVVLTVAIGIGANAAVFSFVDALVLRPFPIPDIERLVMLWETVPPRGVDRGAVAPANFLDWKREPDFLEELVAFDWWDAKLTAGAVPERVQETRASPGFLRMLGVRPFIGRTLAEADAPEEQKTIVLSYALWSRRFAASPDILGGTVLLDGEPYRVVGVAPAGFDYPYGTQVWVPLLFDPETAAVREQHYLEVIGRMREGATVNDVRSRMDVVTRRLEREHPKTNAGRGVHVTLPSLGGSEAERPVATFRVVSAGFFQTVRIPLLRGRTFSDADDKQTFPVAIVSDKMARQFWPKGDPLGRRFRVSGEENAPWVTVVGVVGDVVQDWFLGAPQPTFCQLLAQQPRSGMRPVVRTRDEPSRIPGAVRAELQRLDPDQPLFDTRSMRQILSDRLTGPKYAAVVMGVLGFLALVLATVGIYGVVAYLVSRRTHEIGLRVALGAARADVLTLVLGQALGMTGVGVALGLLLALGAGKLMASYLLGTVLLDLETFVFFSTLLLLTSVVAAYVPARRALAVDPGAAFGSSERCGGPERGARPNPGDYPTTRLRDRRSAPCHWGN